MDLVIRDASLFGRPSGDIGSRTADIGIQGSKIVAVEPNLATDAPGFDAGGRLTCAGLVETHIHLDKTRIIDRCPPEDGRNANAVPRVAANNILNPFTPLGDGNLIRIANMQANICQIGEAHRLRECFAMLTDRSARLMNLKDYGIAVDNPADIVIFDATSPEEAIAEVKAPLVAFKHGIRTVTRPRPEPHRPGRNRP